MSVSWMDLLFEKEVFLCWKNSSPGLPVTLMLLLFPEALKKNLSVSSLLSISFFSSLLVSVLTAFLLQEETVVVGIRVTAGRSRFFSFESLTACSLVVCFNFFRRANVLVSRLIDCEECVESFSFWRRSFSSLKRIREEAHLVTRISC